MIYKFDVPMVEVPSVNHYIGRSGNRTFVKPEALEFKAVVAQHAPLPHPLFDVPVFVHFKVVKKYNRGDGDNLFKLLCDSLNGIAYTDDKLIKWHSLDSQTVNKKSYGVTFVIMPLNHWMFLHGNDIQAI